MKLLKCICAFLFTTAYSFAQLPQTEIWVFDLKQDAMGYSITNPKKVKMGTGYNNQPYFTQDGETMYFVSNGKKGGNTDIYKYQFKNKRGKAKRLTKTKNEAEYSPMLMPGGNKISCVRVAKDTATQNFCTYNLNGKDATILFPNIKTFGYYCWKSQIDLMAFHVPEPFKFIKHNFPYKKHDTLHTNIGRCIQNIRNKIIYVDKTDSLKWQIKILNNKRLGNREYKSIGPDQVLSQTVEGAEDFAFIRGKDIVMAKNGFIYLKKNILSQPAAEWQPIISLNNYGLYDIYRVVVSPAANRIAVVHKLEKPESVKENKK
jgi:hypothetical protein